MLEGKLEVARSKIEANSALFQRLAKFADDQGYPVPNPSAGRWVSSSDEANKALIEAKVLCRISFGRFQHLAWLEYDDAHLVASIGFDHELIVRGFERLEDIRGFDVCLLSEFGVSPRASGAQVYNVVASGNKTDDTDYVGHDRGLVTDLFPKIHLYATDDPMTADIVWPLFLTMSTEESRRGGSWIDVKLAQALRALSELAIESFPYKELCHSTLDLDPRSLYMSLYRCIEATYAHHQSSQLKRALSINADWQQVAAELESVISWRPFEEPSLKAVLAHAGKHDLEQVCDCLGVELTPQSITANVAGKAIYKLRNSIVHYRPAIEPVDIEKIDWNRLCTAMASIAGTVFCEVFGGLNSEVSSV